MIHEPLTTWKKRPHHLNQTSRRVNPHANLQLSGNADGANQIVLPSQSDFSGGEAMLRAFECTFTICLLPIVILWVLPIEEGLPFNTDVLARLILPRARA